MADSTPNPTLAAGDQRHGFTVKRVATLKNLRSIAYELSHDATGARMLHVHSDDAENLFCIAFRTPPSDDTGLPHILEHAVLAGSKRFPVKDPFVEMVKMSMSTFINAMTYPDKTLYPVASNVRQDFFNLAEVYCDAVFHPLITENTFKQEGHHLEFDGNGDPSNKLIVKGIVYNEMKGAFSSPDQVVDRVTQNKLLPDTTYGKESGGDPEHIPELTYEAFKGFYGELYHPTNAYIFVYGDIPTTDQLAFLEPRLAEFKRREINTEIGCQPRWSEPRTHVEPLAVGPNEETQGKSYLILNWLAGDGTDAKEVLAFHVLDHLLIGHAASPLRKALIDSKLGEDLSDSGYMAGRLESSYHIGLKGSEPDRLEALKEVVFTTLKKVVADGFTKEQVDAAFHQLAYRYNEVKTMYPLWVMDRAYVTWIYGADPLIFMRADEFLDELRKQYDADTSIFTRLIQERLLDNPHRLDATFHPDRELQSRREAAFAKRMEEMKVRLSEEEKTKIAREAKELERLQSEPNSPEALATLPQLKTSDLPERPREIPTTIEKLCDGVDVLRNEIFSNGINYLHLDLDLAGLPIELYEYLAFYGECVLKMGAAEFDYVRMAERVVAHTGRVRFWAESNSHVADENRSLRRARFSVKFLDDKVEDALSVFRDILFEMDPTDEARLKDVLVMSKAEHRSNLVSQGLETALRHAARGINVEGAIAEVMGGLPQIRMIEELADEFDTHREKVVEKLLALRGFLRKRGNFTASFTGSDKVYDVLCKKLLSWSDQMGREPVEDIPYPFEPYTTPPREGLAAPSDVSFCGQMIPAPHISHPDSPLLSVASRLLSLGYMWEEVRIKGGAYGGGCGYTGTESVWQFYSYRDPWVKKTLDTFARLRDYVQNADWTQEEIDRAIIGTAKTAERPIRPEAGTGAALWRHICGDTPERRFERYIGIIGATPAEVKRAMLDLFDKSFEKGGVCVLAGREMLENGNKEMADAPLAIENVMK